MLAQLTNVSLSFPDKKVLEEVLETQDVLATGPCGSG
jgi:hypothetical protein